MREPIVMDVRSIWKAMDATPDKNPNYTRGRKLTNEEQWLLWEMWPRKTQRVIGKYLKMCGDTAKRYYEDLQAQGGPEGERPEWMK